MSALKSKPGIRNHDSSVYHTGPHGQKWSDCHNYRSYGYVETDGTVKHQVGKRDPTYVPPRHPKREAIVTPTVSSCLVFSHPHSLVSSANADPVYQRGFAAVGMGGSAVLPKHPFPDPGTPFDLPSAVPCGAGVGPEQFASVGIGTDKPQLYHETMPQSSHHHNERSMGLLGGAVVTFMLICAAAVV